MDTLSIEGYTFLRELGSGGYGRVLLAEKRGSGTLVAIKCFDPVNDLAIQAACSEAHSTLNDLQEAFLEYAQAIRDLPRREGLVAVLNSGRAEDGLPYYISPYVPGSLADLLGNDVFDPVTVGQLPEAHRPRRLKPERVMQIFEQALMALQQMHAAGRVHGDIKPVNLRMTTAGDLCLVDFSVLRTAEGLAARGGFAPNRDCFDYSCPQLRHNPLAAEPSADLYSLACVCYRALTGTLPSGDFAEPAALAPGLDTASNDLLLWMLDPDSNARPLDAATILDAHHSRQRSSPVRGSSSLASSRNEEVSTAGFDSQLIAVRETEESDDVGDIAQQSGPETPTELVQTIRDGHTQGTDSAQGSEDDEAGATTGAERNVTRIMDSAIAATQLMATEPGEGRAELQRQIASLIHQHGRIDQAGHDTLVVFCDIANIPSDSLPQEISEVLANDNTLAAKARLAQRVLDSVIDDAGQVDQAALDDLLGAARYVGWDREDLQRIAGPGQQKAELSSGTPSWRTPEQRRPPPSTSENGKGRLIGILAGVLVVLAAAGFAAWQYLGKKDALVVPIAQPVPVAEIAADRARMETEWDLALQRNSLEGFQDFVDKWPNSPLAERAGAEIEQLRAAEQRQTKLVLQQEQTRDTVRAELIDLGYLDPQRASETSAVNEAISEFELAADLPRHGQADDTTLSALRAERSRREDASWTSALETDSETGYLDYQDRYPEGRYAEQAEQKLAELRQREREQMLAEQLAAEEMTEQRAAEQAAQRRQAEVARAQQRRLAEQRGRSIDQIQDQLQRLGFDIERSGELDPATRDALAALQQPAEEGLEVDQLEAILASLSALPDPVAAISDEPFVPVILRRVEPRYPSRAAREGTEGWLEAELSVDEQGQVTAVSTLDTSHRRLFDREVGEAVRQWRFEPRIVNAEAIPFTTRQRFDFSLGDR